MEKAGQDTSFLLTKIDSKQSEVEQKVVDPLMEKLKKLSDENLVAFRLSKEGYDSVYNIGERWDYNMVRECLEYSDTIHKMEQREYKKQERNNN